MTTLADELRARAATRWAVAYDHDQLFLACADELDALALKCQAYANTVTGLMDARDKYAAEVQALTKLLRYMVDECPCCNGTGEAYSDDPLEHPECLYCLDGRALLRDKP